MCEKRFGKLREISVCTGDDVCVHAGARSWTCVGTSLASLLWHGSWRALGKRRGSPIKGGKDVV